MMQVNNVARCRCPDYRSLPPDSDVHKVLLQLTRGDLCVSCAILIHKSVEMGHVSIALRRTKSKRRPSTKGKKSVRLACRLFQCPGIRAILRTSGF